MHITHSNALTLAPASKQSGPAASRTHGHRAAQSSPNRGLPLEQKLQRKLDATRTTSTQNRVAQANVGSRRERIEATTPADRNGGAARCGCAVANAIRCGVRKKRRQQRAGKSGVIEYIVKVRPELYLQPLGD